MVLEHSTSKKVIPDSSVLNVLIMEEEVNLSYKDTPNKISYRNRTIRVQEQIKTIIKIHPTLKKGTFL